MKVFSIIFKIGLQCLFLFCILENSIGFTTEKGVTKFLAVSSTDLLIWTCSNGISTTIADDRPADLELYCEVLGQPEKVVWYHNGIRIHPESYTYYQSKELVHNVPNWIRYKLRVRNAQLTDGGVYTLVARSERKTLEFSRIYVSITQLSVKETSQHRLKRQRKKRKRRRRHKNNRRRHRRRRWRKLRKRIFKN